MECEFWRLHEINLKIKQAKCQVLSVAMNERVLGFIFTLLSFEYLWLRENWPALTRGFIKQITIEKKIKSQNMKMTLLSFSCMGIG